MRPAQDISDDRTCTHSVGTKSPGKGVSKGDSNTAERSRVAWTIYAAGAILGFFPACIVNVIIHDRLGNLSYVPVILIMAMASRAFVRLYKRENTFMCPTCGISGITDQIEILDQHNVSITKYGRRCKSCRTVWRPLVSKFSALTSIVFRDGLPLLTSIFFLSCLFGYRVPINIGFFGYILFGFGSVWFAKSLLRRIGHYMHYQNKMLILRESGEIEVIS